MRSIEMSTTDQHGVTRGQINDDLTIDLPSLIIAVLEHILAVGGERPVVALAIVGRPESVSRPLDEAVVER